MADMEVKKDLNNTQRKILEEIYIDRVIKAKRDYEQKRVKDRKILCDNLLKNFLKTPSGKAIQKALNSLQLAIKNADEEIEKNKLERRGLNTAFDVKMVLRSMPYDYDIHPDIKEFDLETNRRAEILNDIRNEVRAKVWGMDTSYQDIENEVQSLIRKALGDE